MSPFRIKSCRAALGLTQAELAAKLGVRQASVSDWENGRNKPSPMACERLNSIGNDCSNAVVLVQEGAHAIHQLVAKHGRDECSPAAFARVVLEAAGVIKRGQYIAELWQNKS